MTKVAVAFSGMPRLFRESVISWQKFISKYNADVFVHTWTDHPESGAEIVDMVNHVFNPSSIMMSRLPVVDESPFTNLHIANGVSVYKSHCMWHSVRLANEMIKRSGREYDLIIRARSDHFVEDLQLYEFDGLVVPYDEDKHVLTFDYMGYHMHGLNDCIAYAPPKYMDMYVQTLDLLLPLHRDENIVYIPEILLAAAMCKLGVPLLQQRMSQRLVRG